MERFDTLVSLGPSMGLEDLDFLSNFETLRVFFVENANKYTVNSEITFFN